MAFPTNYAPEISGLAYIHSSSDGAKFVVTPVNFDSVADCHTTIYAEYGWVHRSDNGPAIRVQSLFSAILNEKVEEIRAYRGKITEGHFRAVGAPIHELYGFRQTVQFWEICATAYRLTLLANNPGLFAIHLAAELIIVFTSLRGYFQDHMTAVKVLIYFATALTVLRGLPFFKIENEIAKDVKSQTNAYRRAD
jgi:hypothetical protein